VIYFLNFERFWEYVSKIPLNLKDVDEGGNGLKELAP